MPGAGRRLYRFGEVEVDSARPELRVGPSTIPLRQRTFQVLLHLLEHRDRAVSREELLSSLWKETVVTEGALNQCIVDIRRALGDDPKSPRYVKTYPKTGYRFVEQVEEGLLQAAAVEATSLVAAPLAAVEITSMELEVEEEVPDPPLAVRSDVPELPPARPARDPWLWLAPALLVLVTSMGILAARRRSEPEVRLPEMPGRTPVAVLFFENRAKSPELDWLREGLADMLIADLSRSPSLLLLSRQQLGLILEGLGRGRHEDVDLRTALEIARRSRASALVLGAFQRLGDRVRLDVQLVDGSSGQLRVAETAIAERPEQILSQVDLLALKLSEHLGAPLGGAEAGRTLREVRTESLDAYRYYSLGLERAHALRNDEAIALLSKAIQLDPGFAMAHARIGYALAVTGNQGDEARPHLERALALPERLSPKDRLQVLAWDAIARLDFEAAIHAFERVIAEFPGEVEPYMRLGKLLQGEDRPLEAIEVLRRGLTVDPDSPPIHNLLSSVASDLGRHDEAIEEARAYVARDPQEANAHDSLGMAYQWAGRYDEALSAYDRALSLDPDFGVAIIHQGNTYAELGRRRAALAAFQRYVDVATLGWEKARGLDSQSVVYLAMGDLEAAERAARQAEAHDPEFRHASFRVALERGRMEEAGRLAERVITAARGTGRGQRPPHRVYLVVEGQVKLRSGRGEEAIASFKEALRHRSPRWTLDPLETCLADAYLELGRRPEAIREYERVLAINPRHPMALYRLGLALEGSGMKDEAVRRFHGFLDVWKDADRDAPELVDAGSRLKG